MKMVIFQLCDRLPLVVVVGGDVGSTPKLRSSSVVWRPRRKIPAQQRHHGSNSSPKHVCTVCVFVPIFGYGKIKWIHIMNLLVLMMKL